MRVKCLVSAEHLDAWLFAHISEEVTLRVIENIGVVVLR